LLPIWGIAMPASSKSAANILEIHSAAGTYKVHIAVDSFTTSLDTLRGTFAILADRFFAPIFAVHNLPATLVEAIEENKALDVSPSIIEGLRTSGANRQTELIAVGGGILQDISAFVASIYMRGIAWTYIPTTILAMVDSCIGGKSSINVGPYKNLVGTFHPPMQILIDPTLAQTLPNDQKVSGLIEAAKICFCRGPESFHRHLALKPSTKMTTEDLQACIFNSLESKKWFIEIDEFDKNERLLLNFGHTFGHAIEGSTHFAIPHGIAVGLGILCALSFERANGVDYSTIDRVVLLEGHIEQMISALDSVSHPLRSMSIDETLEMFKSDKKHSLNHFTLILVSENGEVIRRSIPKSPESIEAIKQSLRTVVERFR
jgi:3-dehydroquinate synthase